MNSAIHILRERLRPLASAGVALAILSSCFLFQLTVDAQVKPVRRVLIFYELGTSSPAVTVLDQEIRGVLEKTPYQIELYREYLETILFPDPATQQEFRDWYIHKYRDRKPDLIIALGPSSLQFLVDSHEKFFKDVPIVFGGTWEGQENSPKPDAHFTGVLEEFDPAKSLEAALRLQPGTKHVIVVGGTSAYDRHLEALYRDRLHNYESTLDVVYLTDFAMPQLLDQLSHLAKHTVVLYVHIGQDMTGTRYVSASQSGPMVARVANAPVFTPADVNFGHGEVGGYLHSFADEGKIIGGMAARILRGERPQDIPIAKGANSYLFDWRALDHWGLKEIDLPPGSVVLYRRLTLWQAHKRYILAGISLLFLQALIIVALIWQQAQRKKAQTELVLFNNRLRESEERFRLVANTAPVLIWMSGPDKLCVYFNRPWLEFTGRSLDAELGNGWTEGVHSEDLEACYNTYTSAFDRRESFKMQYRLRRHDGEYRWVFDFGVPRFNPDGSFAGFIGSCIDVTERKMAEEALASLSGRLIEAQEEEHKRIAREIHDDYNQRLAALANDLDELAEHVGESPTATSERLHQLWNGVSEIAADLHTLSHSLHPSTLENLGLVAGMKAFCDEFSGQQQMKIHFACENVPRAIPTDVALCLFRVTQEGLRNIKRHSGTNRAEVRLERIEEKLHLSICDRGRGFDVNQRSPRSGIGIRSMEERLRFLGGHLEVQSRPMQGARIDAWLPFEAARRWAG